MKIETKAPHALHGQRVTEAGILVGYIRRYVKSMPVMAGSISIGSTRQTEWEVTDETGRRLGVRCSRTDALAALAPIAAALTGRRGA